MSILEEKLYETNKKESTIGTKTIITDSFFVGSRLIITKYSDLPENAKEFIILLLSYELNFEPHKLEYYYRIAIQ